MDTYINRSELIRTVKVEDNGIAIAHGSDDKIYHPVTVAQAADELAYGSIYINNGLEMKLSPRL